MSHQTVKRILTSLALLAACAAPGALALQIVTEEYAPFNYTENGKLTGLATEVVTELGRRAKIPLNLDSMPWPQAYDMAQTKSNTCIYSMARLENRERLFKWVGVLATNSWGLFAKNGFNDPIKTLADARPYRIGGVTNDAKVMWLRDNAVTNIVTADEDKLILPMLTLDRKKLNAVDLWVTGMYAQKTVAAAAGASDIKLVLKFRSEPLWLACGPSVAGSTVKSLADALAAMQKDGSYKKILAGYEKRFAP
jgi:polar amino acid transport system substrate-binding protein